MPFYSIFSQDSTALLTSLDSVAYTINWEDLVVVTGSYQPTKADASLYPVLVIDEETIQRRGVTHLQALLQQELGIRITPDGVLGGQLQLQGLSGQNVQIMLDGVPLIGRNGGNIDLDRIALYNIERVEIIEGATSVLYGTNATGGIIHLISKKSQNSQISGTLEAQAETNGVYNANAQFNIGDANWSGQVGYNYYAFQGYSTDTLRAQAWNPKQQHAFNAKINRKIGQFRLGYTFRGMFETVQDLGNIKLGNYPALAYAKDYDFISKSMNHALSLSGYVGNSYYLQGVVGYNYFNREKNAYFTPLLENNDASELDAFDSDTSNFQSAMMRVAFASKFDKKVDFQAGIDFRIDYIEGERVQMDENADQPSAHIGDYAFFGSLTYRPNKKISLQPSVRWSYNTRYKAPFTFAYNMRWNFVKNWTLRASYSRGFRAPSLKELFLDFVDVNHHIKGNPDLLAEQSHSARLSITGQFKADDGHSGSVQCEGFYTYLENQIALLEYATDSLGNYLPADNPTGQFAYFNVETAQVFGTSLRLEYQWKRLSLKFGAMWTGYHNELATDYEDLPTILSVLEFSQEIAYKIPKIEVQLSLFRRDLDQQIRYTTIFNPLNQRYEPIQTTIDGYSLMDLTATRSFWKDRLFLSLGVRNLLGVENVAQSGSAGMHSTGGTLAVGMGRTYFVRLRYTFQKNKG